MTAAALSGTKRYNLPPAFYCDHVSRDLPETGVSRSVSTARTRCVVEMDTAAYGELLSDARHYASDQGWDLHLRGLRLSARATVKALEAQGPPSASPDDQTVAA